MDLTSVAEQAGNQFEKAIQRDWVLWRVMQWNLPPFRGKKRPGTNFEAMPWTTLAEAMKTWNLASAFGAPGSVFSSHEAFLRWEDALWAEPKS